MLGAHMEREIEEQGVILHERAASYLETLRRAFRGRSFSMVLLVARGSSDNAALYLRYLIEIQLGIPVSLAAPSVLTRFGTRVRYIGCLAIGISQSGEAPDVSEVLSSAREGGHTTLAITNHPDSRVALSADHVLPLEVGEEVAVAATKTYTASLLAGYQLVRALGADLADPGDALPDPDWIEKCREAASVGLGPILRFPTLFSLGRGYSFASAQETALKLMECALLPSKSYSTADFEHGPKALATAGTAAIVYGEAPASLTGSQMVIVRPPEGISGALGPIREIVFGQYIALMAARARGLDPDRPENLTKVTRTL
ncbi:MAG TPA: SIS domain-containing protein [Fimbriimonadaceae bacterium]|nr:SIS domain-containing protein [Fimbriimonadaceae bacterium]HRJ96111.1 SIS domain-containing protein [Fimbriimonadaceae bacterium]